jgi:uncharacterized ferritin-like protein (DUF455 family)
MPKRRNFGSLAGRIALLHALAHIELNAIDLGWDIIARFTSDALPRAFFDDWVGVAEEEALHFALLTRRLAEFGARYGDLPAHDGLWESAEATGGDLLHRLAVVPLVLEARGLDVTPKWRLGSSGLGIRAALRSCGASSTTRSAMLRRERDGSAGFAGRAGWFLARPSVTASGAASRGI